MENTASLFDPTTSSEIIEVLLSKLRENYVFPKSAEEMEVFIRQRLSGGDYDTITTGEELAQLLTKHLQEVSKDKHLHVFYRSAARITSNDDETHAEEQSFGLLQNYGFTKMERLPGNIGYLEFHAFYPVDLLEK